MSKQFTTTVRGQEFVGAEYDMRVDGTTKPVEIQYRDSVEGGEEFRVNTNHGGSLGTSYGAWLARGDFEVISAAMREVAETTALSHSRRHPAGTAGFDSDRARRESQVVEPVDGEL